MRILVLKFPANFLCVYPQEGGWEGTRGGSIGIFVVQALENDMANSDKYCTYNDNNNNNNN